MNLRTLFTAVLILSLACPLQAPRVVEGCCPAPHVGELVANADQTVIIIWDAANKMQHFIRKADFKSDGKDFGFVVPTPNQPELEESGNDAFDMLAALTAPQVVQRVRQSGFNIGCAAELPKAPVAAAPVRVLEEKLVAGFNAAVLEADSAEALVTWMKDHDYNYSPAVEAWAKPYIEQKWKFTALKIAKDEPTDDTTVVENKTTSTQKIAAAALRISFKTEQPLFPYREPDYGPDLDKLQAKQRLLRFFFIADSRYQGTLTKEQPWTGKVVWSNPVDNSYRELLLKCLKLPTKTGPKEFWLTEFEDRWPYEVAPADLHFAAAADQSKLERPPVYAYSDAAPNGDLTFFALLGFVALPLIYRRKKTTKP